MIKLQKYLNVRYVLASEACWWLFNFGLQKRSYTVKRLSVHLSNQQSITFHKSGELSSVLRSNIHTKLTRYFELCANNPDDEEIQQLKYADVPKKYI